MAGNRSEPFDLAIADPHEVTWSEVLDSAGGGAVTVTHSGEAGRTHYVVAFLAVIRTASPTADIVVEMRQGAAVLWRDVIGSGAARGDRIGVAFPRGFKIGNNTDVSLVCTAGGGSTITTADLCGYTI